jgi:hypothetical protein
MSDKALDENSLQGLSSSNWRLAGIAKRNHRNTSLKLICTTLLGLAVTAASPGPAKSYLQRGIKLLDQGLFAASVVMFTSALQQNPKDVRACYYRALAHLPFCYKRVFLSNCLG